MARHLPLFLLLGMAVLAQATPASLQAWALHADGLSPVSLPARSFPIDSPTAADLDADGVEETLSATAGRLALVSHGQIVWQSPPEWQVVQAGFGDLNQDGSPEVALLLWRPFQPWPVDAFLPHGGRIATFHDQAGDSCHLILVGLINHRFGELWAGSALADPVLRFGAADLNGDQSQELITLEGRYARTGATSGLAIKIWEWNGFGFSVVSTLSGSFSSFTLVQDENERILVLTP